MDQIYITFFVFFILSGNLGLFLKLPSYLTPCSRNDPNLDECALKHGSVGFKAMLKGDPKYGIPVLDPLEIKEIKINDGSLQTSLSITMSNIKIYGLSKTVLKNTKFDLTARKIQWIFLVKMFEILMDYKVSGQVLILPINGEGPGNLTLNDLLVTYNADYHLFKKGNGKEYASLGESNVHFDTSRVYVHLENLFNGDKQLGDAMNTFLNENWRELKDDIGPSIAEALSEVMKQILDSVLSVVPFDEVFPDTV